MAFTVNGEGPILNTVYAGGMYPLLGANNGVRFSGASSYMGGIENDFPLYQDEQDRGGAMSNVIQMQQYAGPGQAAPQAPAGVAQTGAQPTHTAGWWLMLAVLLLVLIFGKSYIQGEKREGITATLSDVAIITLTVIVGLPLFKFIANKLPIKGLTEIINAA